MARSLFKTSEAEPTTMAQRPSSAPKTKVRSKTEPLETQPTPTKVRQKPRRPLSVKRLSQLSAVVVLLAAGGLGLSQATGTSVLGIPVGHAFSKENLTYVLMMGNLKVGRFHAASELAKGLPTRVSEDVGEVEYTQPRLQIIKGLVAQGAFAEAYSLVPQLSGFEGTATVQIFQTQFKKEGLKAALAQLDQLPARLQTARESAISQLELQQGGAIALTELQQLATALKSPVERVSLQHKVVFRQVQAHDIAGAFATVETIEQPEMRTMALRNIAETVRTPEVARQVLAKLEITQSTDTYTARLIAASLAGETATMEAAFQALQAHDAKFNPNVAGMTARALLDLARFNPQQALRFYQQVASLQTRTEGYDSLAHEAVGKKDQALFEQAVALLEQINTKDAKLRLTQVRAFAKTQGLKGTP